MAGLWTGTSINSTETAMLFNQLYDSGKPIAMVRKKNGLLYSILGKKETGATPMSASWERLQKITGSKIEVKLLGKLKAIAAVADGSAEMATATLVNSQDYWGASTFDLCHYADAHGLPDSELMRIAGKEAKTLSYIDNVMQMLTLSLEAQMASSSSTYGGLHDTKAPARTTFGGWQWAVSNGVTADGESAYATYGTIDRSDSGNADYRAYVSPSVGDLTLAKIATVKNNVIGNGGEPNVGVAHTTPYTKIQQLVQSYTIATYDETWSQFGGDWFQFQGIKFILDQRAPSTVLGLFDPTSWCMYQNTDNFTSSGIIRDPSRVASHVLNWSSWLQLICLCPSHNGKLTGITS